MKRRPVPKGRLGTKGDAYEKRGKRDEGTKKGKNVRLSLNTEKLLGGKGGFRKV